MIRASIEQETGFPESLTLRSAVEWYKKMTSLVTQATAEERKYIDARWGALVIKLAEDEGVPVGWLSWALSALAEQETRLLQTAAAEGEQALAAGARE